MSVKLTACSDTQVGREMLNGDYARCAITARVSSTDHWPMLSGMFWCVCEMLGE